MRFGWELLILLLLTSIGPMALMRTIAVGSVQRFGYTLLDRVQENRITSEQERMLLIADAHARVSWEAKAQVEAVLMAPAAQAEQLLAGPTVSDSRVYVADDFDAGFNPPGGTMAYPLHARQTGARRPAGEVFSAVLDAVTGFRGSRGQEDDITLVVLRVLEVSQPPG